MNLFQSENIRNFWNSIESQITISVVEGDEINGRGSLQGLLFYEPGVKGRFSRRCVVWGGPVVDNSIVNKKEICRTLLSKFISELDGRAIYLEFRNTFDCTEYSEVFKEFGFEFHEHLNYITLLDDETSVKKRISESKLRQIKKTIKAGAEIVVSSDESEIQEFYSLLCELYRTKVKTPLPGLEYFINFSKYNVGVYLLIKYQGRIIGGLMGGVFGNTIYELYVCGEDGKYKDVYPSVLATYAAIDYGLKNGLEYFDFLGAGKPNEDYGVREFKSKFGGELVNYGRFRLILNRPLYKLGELAIKIIKKYG